MRPTTQVPIAEKSEAVKLSGISKAKYLVRGGPKFGIHNPTSCLKLLMINYTDTFFSFLIYIIPRHFRNKHFDNSINLGAPR